MVKRKELVTLLVVKMAGLTPNVNAPPTALKQMTVFVLKAARRDSGVKVLVLHAITNALIVYSAVTRKLVFVWLLAVPRMPKELAIKVFASFVMLKD